MSKRKATIDLSDQLLKVQKSQGVIEVPRQGEKRRRDRETHHPSVKQRIRSPTPVYCCSIHDDDRDVCPIYDCSGGRSSTKSLYNYIN